MRLPRTLSRYVAREVAIAALLGLLALGVVLVSRNLLRFSDELFRAGPSARELGLLIACLAGMLVGYALPLSFLFGALLAVGRLAADTEVTAMRACGLGLRSLVAPVLALGIAASGLAIFLALEVEPRAQHELRMVVKSLAARGLAARPGEFQEIDERVLYVRERGPEGTLRGVLLSDRSDPKRPYLIFAESGEIELDRERGALVLRLADGAVHAETAAGEEERDRRIAFERFDYAFEARGLLGSRFTSLRPREMTVAELSRVVARAEAGDPLDELRRREPAHYRVHLHRRFALPLAPIPFALLAVPLGLGRARGTRARGTLVCALLALAYYALLTAGQDLALEGRVPVAAALWLPNASFAAAGLGLLARSGRPGHGA